MLHEKAPIGKLHLNDFIKGAIIAFLTAILTGVYTAIEAGSFSFTWDFFKPIVLAGVGGAIAYILKNYLTNSDGKLLKKEGE
jgi:hypothetical protein